MSILTITNNFIILGASFPADVPGGIFSDLENAGLIQKNLIGFNDVNNRWVANESIAYVTNIEGKSLCFSYSNLIYEKYDVQNKNEFFRGHQSTGCPTHSIGFSWVGYICNNICQQC